MEATLEHLHKDIIRMKADIALIKHILVEEGELTEWAKKQLELSRATPEDEYLSLEDV